MSQSIVPVYVRLLTDEEAKTQLNSVDDLIKHNIITHRHYQGTYTQ